MCYLLLNYLLLADFLNETVDMLKKIFIQGDVNLQFFSQYSEKLMLLLYIFCTNVLVLSE